MVNGLINLIRLKLKTNLVVNVRVHFSNDKETSVHFSNDKETSEEVSHNRFIIN